MNALYWLGVCVPCGVLVIWAGFVLAAPGIKARRELRRQRRERSEHLLELANNLRDAVRTPDEALRRWSRDYEDGVL